MAARSVHLLSSVPQTPSPMMLSTPSSLSSTTKVRSAGAASTGGRHKRKTQQREIALIWRISTRIGSFLSAPEVCRAELHASRVYHASAAHSISPQDVTSPGQKSLRGALFAPKETRQASSQSRLLRFARNDIRAGLVTLSPRLRLHAGGRGGYNSATPLLLGRTNH